jgi:hypothetical protein
MDTFSGKHLPVNKRLVAAASLWLASVCLMLLADVNDQSDLGRTAVLLGVMACMPTMWLIVEHVVAQECRGATRGICEAIGRGQAEGHVRHLR